jgi:hypothetical protein
MPASFLQLDEPWTNLGRTLDEPWTYLGRTLDVPSHYFVFTKRIFLVIIILYEALTALRILKILKAQKRLRYPKKIAKPLCL